LNPTELGNGFDSQSFFLTTHFGNQPQESKVAISLITDFAKTSLEINLPHVFSGNLKKQQSAISSTELRGQTSYS